MGKRGIGALVGAAVLLFAAVGSVAADKPAYAIDVTKAATPETVPAGGGDVQFTVTVENTGTGDFQIVQLTDSMGGCTFGAPSGDSSNPGVFDDGETWTYTCIVNDVDPETTNTVTVDACHNNSPNCKQDEQKTEAGDEVTVGLCESDCEVLPSDNGGGGGESDLPTQAPTDTTVGNPSAPSDAAWLLVVALGLLIGSPVVLRPARSARHRS